MKRFISSAAALVFAFGCLVLPAGYAERSALSAFAISYDDLIEDSVSCFEYETLSADDNTIEITGYTGSGGKVVIPEEIDGKRVISIRDNAFAGEWNDETQQTESDIKSVVISEGVEKIGSYAFSGCCELTEVTVPQSVKTIGAYAFENTPWLEALRNEAPLVIINGIVIDASVCAGEIIIPDNVTSIADYAFKDCKELTSAVVPESVTDIGSHAFSGCESLESITLPDGLEEIGAKTFSNCVSLKSIDIPSSVKRIGEMAFSGCKSLSEIILPEGVTDIGAYAFVDTTAVTSVSIPASVTEIGERAFGFYTQYDESIYDYSYYYLDGFELEVFYDTAGEEYAKTYRFKHSVSYLPHTHRYSSEIVREPSCTEEGTMLFTCSCGDTYEQAIEPTGHSAVMESAVKPTCTTMGKTEGVYCYICGEVLKAPEPVPATGHEYSALWTIDKAATCTATGLRSHHCTVCNAKTNVTVIPQKNHTYKTTIVPPTYEAQGYTLHKCSVCGSSYKDSYTAVKTVPALKAKTTYTCTTNAVRINWNKVSGATGYKVYRYNHTTKKWVALKAIYDPNVLTYKDSGLKAGTVYKYRVKAFVKSDGKFYFGKSCDTITTATRPAAATVTKANKTSTAVRLFWKNVTCTGYKIQRYNTATKKWVTVKYVPTGTTNYKISGLKKNTSYKFRILAYRYDGKKNIPGAWSYYTVKTAK